MLDVVIVGAGPAGIACAIRCVELGMKPLLLEQGVVANTIAEYPKGKKMFGVAGFFQSNPQDLVDLYKRDLSRAKVDVREGHKVVSVIKKDGFFEVSTKKGNFRARAVVVAIGVQGIPQTLGVSGEDGSNVHNKVQDPKLYSGKSVIVVGGGDTAVENAIILSEAGANVTLSYRRPEFFRVKDLNLERLSKSGVEVKMSTNVVEIKRKSAVLRHATDFTEELRADDVFIFVGTLKNVEFFRDLGLEFDEKGNIKYDEDTFETSVKGVFIAGDITSDRFKLIMPAMCHGLKVASSVLSYKTKAR